MPIPNNKESLHNAIISNYTSLVKELSSIPIELTTVKELEGHAKNTLMSINNLIAYLVGWGNLVLKWINQKEQGIETVFPENGYKWNELGLLAQKFYTDYKDDDFPTLCEKLERINQLIVHKIEGYSNDDLYEVAWYDKWTLGRMIQLNTSSPYKNAVVRIRKWKKEKKKLLSQA
jgi:hypothetical protein